MQLHFSASCQSANQPITQSAELLFAHCSLLIYKEKPGRAGACSGFWVPLGRVLLLDVVGVEVPDVFGVLGDGTVGGEFACGGDVHQGGDVPCLVVAVEGFNAVLCSDVVREVLEEHVVVVEVEEVFEDGLEDAGGHQAEDVAADHVECALDLGVGLVDGLGVVGGAEGYDFFGLEAEDEAVVFAGFFGDFNIGAVEGADGEGAVEHQLHVAGAGGFHTCEGDLLGDVGCRDDLFCEGDAVVGEEGDGDAALDEGVVVDDVCDTVDEADDELCEPVSGCCLRAEDEDAGVDVEVGLFNQSIEEDDDVEDEEELALVLVEALDLDVEDGVGVGLEAEGVEDRIGEDLLVGALDVGVGGEEAAVLCEGFELGELAEVGDPLVADGVGDEVGQTGVRLEEPAALCDAVGLIGEVVGHDLVEVLEDGLLQDFGVEGGHAVDGAGTDEAEVGHADVLVAGFVDEAHAAEACDVAGIERGDLLEEACVDLVDDLHVSGQDALHEGEGPALECFGENGVIGITGGGANDLPGFFPVEAFHIDEDAHQFGDDERWVGIVELDEDVLRQVVDGVAFFAEAAQDVVHGGCDEEVLLAEAELLTLHGGVVRVEDLGEVLGENFAFHGFNVVTAVEFVEGEFVGGLCAPEAEGINVCAAEADDRQVVGDGLHLLCGDPDPFVAAGAAGVVLDVAAEADEAGVFGALHFPGIAVFEPVIRLFALLAIDHTLTENTVVVAQAVARRREVERGERVHEAGCEAAETAIAETGVHFVVAQTVPVEAERVHSFAALVLEAEVDHVVTEEAADEELEREVIDAADLCGAVSILRGHPAVNETVAHSEGERLITVTLGGAVIALCQGETHIPEEVLREALCGKIGRRVLAGERNIIDFALCRSHNSIPKSVT